MIGLQPIEFAYLTAIAFAVVGIAAVLLIGRQRSGR
jgi:uncharacterized membrane protein YuzA (DUF378 family)